MQIFLAPRSNETSYKHFLSTIENGVDFTIVEPHLDDEGRKQLQSMGNLLVWGNKESKKSSWDRMERGDLVLFYKGRENEEREGKIVYGGKLLYKQHSRELGLALWPPKPHEEAWSCIFFLEDLKPLYIPITEITDLAEYKRNFIVQGFMPLNEQGTRAIIKKFGNIEKFLDHYAFKEVGIDSDLEESEKFNEITAHAEAELLLLKIGKLLGFDTYSPDKSKEAFGEVLKDHITLPELPTRFLGNEILPLVREIDVLWFKDEAPQYAFEVEHSTKFGNGFQRLGQLKPLSTRLFIISARQNYYLFEKFINTDPYFRYKSSFRFRDYKQLENYFKAVDEFAAIKGAFLDN